MEETSFQPQFEYFDDKFEYLDGRMDRLEIKVDNIQTSLDGVALMAKNSRDEIVVINSRLEKLKA